MSRSNEVCSVELIPSLDYNLLGDVRRGVVVGAMQAVLCLPQPVAFLRCCSLALISPIFVLLMNSLRCFTVL